MSGEDDMETGSDNGAANRPGGSTSVGAPGGGEESNDEEFDKILEGDGDDEDDDGKFLAFPSH
jgi:hypothetical protein